MRLKLFLILGKSEACVLKKVVLKKKRVLSIQFTRSALVGRSRPEEPEIYGPDRAEDLAGHK